MADFTEKEQQLGAEALELICGSLTMRFRFLDRALRKLQPFEAGFVPGGATFTTDAQKVIYDPQLVAKRFMDDPDGLVRDVIHLMIHCLFLHPFCRADVNRRMWNLACDIVCESLAMRLSSESFPCDLDDQRKESLETLEDDIGQLSAEKLYFHLMSGAVDEVNLLHLSALFQRDHHRLWYHKFKDEKPPEPPDGGASFDEGQQALGIDGLPSDADTEATWEELAQKMKADLQNNAQRYGREAGEMTMMLRASNKKRSDYRSFLRRFARPTETMRLDPDEFDLIYYKFGMDTYGNMPLIEPLEYREENKVDALAIAIDTSGSVQGEVVERFLAETLDILQEVDAFKDDCEIRIIQCDAKVQKETVIHGKAEIDQFSDVVELRGFGGTDFRPVFDHLDELIREGAIGNLRGVIYFTDGMGTYPTSPPDYEAAFILSEETPGAPPVPAWAYKVLINPLDLSVPEQTKEIAV